jgi:broad specificity phosphatase PhoE
MNTNLYLIRHGQTATNRAQIIQGWDNEPLNARGRQQANLTGEHLAGAGIDALYASPLGRARETAEIIGRAIGMPPTIVAGLREMNTGKISGLHGSQFMVRYPQLWWAWLRDDARLAFPNGDRLAEFYQRAAEVIDELVARHHGQTLAVVSHGGTISGYLSYLIDGRGSNRVALRLRNCAICQMRWEADQPPRVVAFNDTSHLRKQSPPIERPNST